MGYLALAHVRHHQPVRDLGPDQSEQQDVEDRVVVIYILKEKILDHSLLNICVQT